MTSVTTGGKTTTYAYDADGIRTTKVVGGVTHEYLTLNGKVVYEKIGTGNTAKIMVFIYDAQGRPFAVKYSKNNGESFTNYFYALNLQGDVVKIFRPNAVKDANETTIGYTERTYATYSYNAWGELIGITDSNGNSILNKQTTSTALANLNPLRYRGYYYDNETGFYYLQSRYYDPANRRFINADVFTSTNQGFLSHNMYAYCLNNPVVCADTNGNYTYYVVNSVETKEVGVDDKGFVIYETTVDYTSVTLNAYALFSPETRTDGSVTFQYTVDNRGAVVYDSRKNEGRELLDEAISTVLAKEMYSAATNQVNGALSGRTIDGIAKELRRHTQFSFLGEKIGVADIGGLDKNKPDYDYNARMFENPWKALSVIFEMVFK